MISVQIATESKRSTWEAFVTSAENTHHAFCWQWRDVISQTFGHTPHYLMATDAEDHVCGVLPLFHVKSRLFGSALISVPYLNAGGVLTNSPEAGEALIAQAAELAQELSTDYLELRERSTRSTTESGLIERSHKVSMVLPLAEDPELLFASFKPKLRSQIRRPSKSGVTAVVDERETVCERSISDFYRVFSEHMRDLGTPVFPREFFRLAKQKFSSSCRVITIWHDKHPVSAGITIGCGQNTEMLWAASLRSANTMSPNMLLYWEAMKRAILDNYRVFDFGRSSYESGQYNFKRQWGAEEVPLHWHYRVFRGDVPDINPNNPRFALMVRCWQRMPLLLSNRLGPWITRSLP